MIENSGFDFVPDKTGKTGFLVLATDMRDHVCFGRVFFSEEKANEYREYVDTKLMGKHVDTAEGGHYFINYVDVYQVQVEEE